jgi:hypothetical protein
VARHSTGPTLPPLFVRIGRACLLVNLLLLNVPSGARGELINPNPFASKTPPMDGDTAKTMRLRAEAAAVAANVLAAAGINGFQSHEIPPDLATFHAIWSMADLVGALRINEKETIHSASVTFIAKAAERCKGSFASLKLPSADADTVRMKTACLGSQTETDEHAYINIVKRRQGGVYYFVVLGTKGAGEAAVASGGRVFEAALKKVPRAIGKSPAALRRRHDIR